VYECVELQPVKKLAAAASPLQEKPAASQLI
jgi:hypothetical protein